MPLPVARLASFYFVYYAAIGVFTPFFSLFLADRKFSATAISGMMALWYGTRIVSPSLWGYLTLHSPQPIRWLRIGAVATLSCAVGFVFDLPLPMMILVMAGFSFFCNAIMPQFEAITLSHLVDAPHRYSSIRWWGSLGFLLMAIGLGGVFERIGIDYWPWLMLPLLAALVATSWLNDYGPAHARDGQRESIVSSLRRPGVINFLLTAFLMQLAYGPYYVFLSLHLHDHGYGTGWTGFLWSLGVMAEIVMFWFAAPWLARHGATRILPWTLAVAAVRFAAIGWLAQSLPAMLFAQLSHAITFGLFHACCMQRAAQLFPPALQGQGQGLLYGLSSGVGGVIGSLVAGWAWQHGAGPLAFSVAAGFAVLGVVVAAQARPHHARANENAMTSPMD
jgi:PPP family 3-phenylpropionic acid transporter